MQMQISLNNCLLFCGLLAGLLFQPSCSRQVPGGGEQGGKFSENVSKVVQVIENRPQKQAAGETGPVDATLRVEPARIGAGELVTLIIDARIATGWHIYAMDKPAGIGIPSRIRLSSPSFVEETGAWTADEPPHADLQGQEFVQVHNGHVTFRCPARIAVDAPKRAIRVQCALIYQACDRFSCEPVDELTLETEVVVLP